MEISSSRWKHEDSSKCPPHFITICDPLSKLNHRNSGCVTGTSQCRLNTILRKKGKALHLSPSPRNSPTSTPPLLFKNLARSLVSLFRNKAKQSKANQPTNKKSSNIDCLSLTSKSWNLLVAKNSFY